MFPRHFYLFLISFSVTKVSGEYLVVALPKVARALGDLSADKRRRRERLAAKVTKKFRRALCQQQKISPDQYTEIMDRLDDIQTKRRVLSEQDTSFRLQQMLNLADDGKISLSQIHEFFMIAAVPGLNFDRLKQTKQYFSEIVKNSFKFNDDDPNCVWVDPESILQYHLSNNSHLVNCKLRIAIVGDGRTYNKRKTTVVLALKFLDSDSSASSSLYPCCIFTGGEAYDQLKERTLPLREKLRTLSESGLRLEVPRLGERTAQWFRPRVGSMVAMQKQCTQVITEPLALPRKLYHLLQALYSTSFFHTHLPRESARCLPRPRCLYLLHHCLCQSANADTLRQSLLRNTVWNVATPSRNHHRLQRLGHRLPALPNVGL